VHKELTFGGDEGLSVTRRKKERKKGLTDGQTDKNRKRRKAKIYNTADRICP